VACWASNGGPAPGNGRCAKPAPGSCRRATLDDVQQAVRDAVARLLPPAQPHRLTIAGTADSAHTGVALVPAATPDGPVLRAGVPGFGTTYLAAPAPALQALLPSFEALFAQVVLVVERIALAGEVSRRDGEAYFRTLIQSASDVILIVADDDRIRYASPSATTVLGWPEPTGTPLAALIAEAHHEVLHEFLARARAGRSDGVDLSAVCADGRRLDVECTVRDLRADPTVGGLVLTVRDVTERRRLENDLAHQAFHDGLTGLANRVLFRNRLEHAFARSSDVAVLFVDLDDFKEINDTLGHAVGDQLLLAVAQRIAQAVGPLDTAARMGGDEFAVLLEPERGPAMAEEVADRIVAALSVPVEVTDGLGGTHVVSGAASVGVASSRDAASATELLRHADLALYLAKSSGKGGWQHYQSNLHTAMVHRHEMRTALHEAVQGEQFVLQFQPIVDLATGAVAGVESLVRWRHPARGLLGPNQFIELAEESGAVVAIGAWVLRESLRRIAGWRASAPPETLRYVSVNVSARQFRTPGFVDQVRAALAETGARPEWLLLEITESLLLRDADQVWADLRALRELGVRVAIDDFGTGYSSLSYLRQMPVDVLKIDKSFIDDVLGSPQQRALVNAIVTLARDLELAVVAEGIEDEGQRALLSRMGCPYGQGYLFARPLWPADVPALLPALAAVTT
jgi:diguanylate cyclase (GGDEF)-like protein/PAS domain S-box-containing protein